MNTRPPIEVPSERAVLSVAFNEDSSRFSVGLNTGFCIYATPTCDVVQSRDFNAGLGLVQMMGRTNYVALVGGGPSPRYANNKVMIYDDREGKIALEISTMSPVLGVQLSRKYVVVVLHNAVRVYAFERQPRKLATYETADNPNGLCALSESWLVFPGRTPGQVQLVELGSDKVSIIPAHSGRLQALALSSGKDALVATASDKGTMIRVFATTTCAKVAERRRGTESTVIFSLRFSPSGAMLACTSAKGNLHIFDIPGAATQEQEQRQQQQQQQQNQKLNQLNQAPQQEQPQHRPSSSSSQNQEAAANRWGILSNIPWGPFSDLYSFASAPFAVGSEDEGTVKGVVGWMDEESLVVVGAGRDARWEKFLLTTDEDDKPKLVRMGWKRYGGP